MSLAVQLYTQNKEMLDAWAEFFAQESSVDLIHNDILETDADAIVSPANSFGFMDGGLDYQLSEKFGWDIQDVLQQEIQNSTLGELLIGSTLTLETKHPIIKYIISAPTMRVPMNYHISTSINAYLAMKAILIEAINHPKINKVAIPGLCTGVGRMPFDIASGQMFYAFEEVIKGVKRNFVDFGEAQAFQIKLNRNSMIWD